MNNQSYVESHGMKFDAATVTAVTHNVIFLNKDVKHVLLLFLGKQWTVDKLLVGAECILMCMQDDTNTEPL